MDLSKYHTAKAAKRPLLLEGTPFPLPVASELLFSADSRWAIVSDGFDYRTRKPGDYVIDLATGAVRLLPGSEARFVP